MAEDTQPADKAGETQADTEARKRFEAEAKRKAEKALKEKQAAKMAADPKAKKKAKKKPEIFHVHSLVRSQETRVQRAQAARRPRFKQMLGGGLIRLVRKRPVPVARPLIEKLRRELLEKEKEGILKVTLPDGRRVDITTLKPLELKKKLAPKPQPKQDSAADDKTFEHGVGVEVPQVPGGLPQGATPPLPEAMKGMPEGVDAVPQGTEPEGEEPEEDLEAVTLEVYENWTHQQLKNLAPEYEVTDLSGNKTALAVRLVEAGLRLAPNEEEGE